MLKKLVSMAAAAAMLLPMGGVFAAAQAESPAVTREPYKKMLKLDEGPAHSGLYVLEKTHSAGISAKRDSDDFLLDCGDRAGYDYLGTLPDGDEMQELYDDMLETATDLWNDTDTTLDYIEGYVYYGVLPSYGLDFDQMSIVYYTFRNDNPVFYFAGGTSASDGFDFLMLSDPAYRSGSARRSAQKSIIDYVTATAEKAEAAETDYEKALIVHDAINEDVEYALDSNYQPSREPWAHNILGAAEKGSGVCETYARTFQAVMNYLDVENYLVTGKARGEDHAWNLIRMDDGHYYYVDCTWDDSTDSLYYFVKGSKTFGEDHTPDRPGKDPMGFLIQLPAASRWDFDPYDYTPAPDVLGGDISGDGIVDVRDVTLIASYVKGFATLNGDELSQADINGDGVVNTLDISILAAIVKGLI